MCTEPAISTRSGEPQPSSRRIFAHRKDDDATVAGRHLGSAEHVRRREPDRHTVSDVEQHARALSGRVDDGAAADRRGGSGGADLDGPGGQAADLAPPSIPPTVTGVAARVMSAKGSPLR